MKKFLFLFLALFVSEARLAAQSAAPVPIATETIQQSQSGNSSTSPAKSGESVEPANLKSQARESILIKIPAGTPIEIEAAYTVSSLDIKPGELLSFRVLIPIIMDGVTAIEKGALVTARVTLAKRGGQGKGRKARLEHGRRRSRRQHPDTAGPGNCLAQ